MKRVVLLCCTALSAFGQFTFAQGPPDPAPNPRPEPRVAGADVRVAIRSNRDVDRLYRDGTRMLDRGDWERAAEAFTAVIERKGERLDGAYYWKAYALGKAGKRDEALAQLMELERVNPKTRWLDDARALGVEMKQASGLAVSADVQNDEELKLIALNGLVDIAPERVIPSVQELLKKSSSPRLKERALFVLAQSDSTQARDILAQFARGRGNPDLQLKAVEYLGMQKNNGQLLAEIYAANTDTAVRRRVLQAYMMSRDKDHVLQAARSEQDPELRREAISLLGALKAEPELTQLYSNESNVELKKRIIHSLRGANSAKSLVEIARKETSPELKREAVQMLTSMRTKEATEFLMELVSK